MLAVQKRRPGRFAAVLLLALTASLVAAAAALVLPPFTTAPKSAPGGGGQAQLSGVATGCHGSFDRFVIRARFATPRYDVRYVRRIIADGSGATVPLRGTKRIRILFPEARGHTESGANLLPRVRTPLCPNLRQLKTAGDFEGVVTIGLGLRRRTGFRVFRLTGPARLVVDVAH